MSRRRRKNNFAAAACMLLLTVLPAGCGENETYEEAGISGEQMDTAAAATEETGSDATDIGTEDAENGAAEDAGDDVGKFLDALMGDSDEEISDQASADIAKDESDKVQSGDEKTDWQYLKKYMVEDFFGDTGEYEMYAPAGATNEDGLLSYYEHGIWFTGAVYSDESRAMLYGSLDMAIEAQKEDWEEGTGISDVEVGETQKNGDDRYAFLSARAKDANGTAYERKMIFYLDVREEGVGVIWNLEIAEFTVDDQTELIVDEIEKCYGVSLDALTVSGEWAKEDAQFRMEQQDIYEPAEGEAELARIDGYQYLGTTTLSLKNGTIQCPIMLPMGRGTSVREDGASAVMHGVSVHVQGYPTISKNYFAEVEDSADFHYRDISEYEEGNQNVELSEIMPMDGLSEAVYFVVTYDEPDRKGENYYRQADMECFIRLEEKYLLNYTIWLSSEKYDAATNTLLKELETAYGIDLSEYYNKNE